MLFISTVVSVLSYPLTLNRTMVLHRVLQYRQIYLASTLGLSNFSERQLRDKCLNAGHGCRGGVRALMSERALGSCDFASHQNRAEARLTS